MNEETSGTAESNNPQTTAVDNQPSQTNVDFDLDAILDAYLGEEVEAVDNHSIPVQEVLDNLDTDAKRILQNLRKDYTKKLQKVGEQKRQLEERERTWLSRQEDILRSKMQLPADFNLDAEGGVQTYIESKIAEMLLEQQKPLIEQVQMDQKRQFLQDFRRQNPDIDNYRDAIVEEMAKNPGVDLVNAYYIAKGKASDQRLNEVRLELEKQKETKLDAVRKVSTGNQVQAVGRPAFRNALDALDWLNKQKR